MGRVENRLAEPFVGFSGGSGRMAYSPCHAEARGVQSYYCFKTPRKTAVSWSFLAALIPIVPKFVALAYAKARALRSSGPADS